jgi:4-hydroxybenzoate polyprenyltransferase
MGIRHELVVSYQFVRNDLWATIAPAGCFAVAAARYAHRDPLHILFVALTAVVYFWLYIYGFCLTNQLAGVEEDRINKPFRPLVSGLSSRRGAVIRAVVVSAAFPLVAWRLGVLPWALGWQALYLPNNLAGWARSWLYKDLVIGLGTTVELGAAWQLAAPIPAMAWRWIITLSAAVFLLIPLQDLRDLAGDAAVGRRTFPMVFGPVRTRWLLAAGFTALAVAVHLLLMAPLGGHWAVWACEAVLALFSLWIAVRIVSRRTPQQDHVSYRRFEQWYAVAMLAAIIVL